MKKFPLMFFAVVLLAACESGKSGEGDQAETEASSKPTGPNQLSEKEKEDGWKLLFDGTSMAGWKTYQNKENDSWEVVDGTLHCRPDSVAKKRADILTVDQYDNFDLVFEFKIAPRDNSGVIYRATEEFGRPYHSGPEYQVIDDKNYPGELTSTQLTGSNYDMHAAPEDKRINPPGEWNTGRIVANGNHIEHWLNGQKVAEYEINSEDWKKRKEASKWKDVSGYGMATKGHIDLQDHGGEAWYRNIKIRTL
ncbi:MAG: DUF1080 domain-containing protein [Bacteroidota bacterium]|nr:DUF1080 domain-containing protein [Bacteroidota bacterium]